MFESRPDLSGFARAASSIQSVGAGAWVGVGVGSNVLLPGCDQRSSTCSLKNGSCPPAGKFEPLFVETLVENSLAIRIKNYIEPGSPGFRKCAMGQPGGGCPIAYYEEDGIAPFATQILLDGRLAGI